MSLRKSWTQVVFARIRPNKHFSEHSAEWKEVGGASGGVHHDTHTHRLALSCSHFLYTHQKQLPWSGPGWAGCPQRAGLGGCSLCSCHCCTLHWDLWAWRSRCAACSRRCRCSVHPETVRKQNQPSPICIHTELTAIALHTEKVSGHPMAPPANRCLLWRQLCAILPLWQPPSYIWEQFPPTHALSLG